MPGPTHGQHKPINYDSLAYKRGLRTSSSATRWLSYKIVGYAEDLLEILKTKRNL